MPTAACIFDMDGVLIDSGAWHRAAWEALLREIGVRPREPDFWRLTIGRPSEEAMPLVLGRRLSDDESWRLAQRKRELYLELAEQGTRAVAGVRAFVESLAAAGVPRAVGTSASHRDVDWLLADVGLRHHFDVVVTSEDVTLGKPDPEVYVLAARRLRVAPSACVVFEDSIVGIHAALRAGMRAVGVTTAYTAGELTAAGAERAVASFEEVEWSRIARR